MVYRTAAETADERDARHQAWLTGMTGEINRNVGVDYAKYGRGHYALTYGADHEIAFRPGALAGSAAVAAVRDYDPDREYVVIVLDPPGPPTVHTFTRLLLTPH